MAKILKGTLVKKEGVYSIIASTDEIDRDNEIILASSFKESLPIYLEHNPVILFAHNYSAPPIGKAIGGRITENALILDIEFAETEFGKEIKYLYDNKFMNAFSVGFIPEDWDRDPEGRTVFIKNELLETSAVPVPSNRLANMMRTAKSAGVDLTEVNKLFLKDKDNQTPEPKGDPVEGVKSQFEINKSIYGGLAK